MEDALQDRRRLRPVACRCTREILVGHLAVERQHLVDDAERVLLEKNVPRELLELRLPRRAGLLELHQHRPTSVSRAAGQVDDDGSRRVTAHKRLDDRAQLEHRAGVLGEGSADSADRDRHGLAAGARATTHLADERRELTALVVPDDDLTALDLVGELLRDVVVERMHQRLPPSAPAARRRPPRARLPPFVAGASSRLFSAAFTAGEVRSRTSSSTERVGISRRCPLAVRALDPEDVLETVGDGEASVRRALRHDALGPEVHREVRPVVLAIAQGVPRGLELLLPGLVLWNEPPERREVDDDPVVEVRFPERRHALHLVEERAQLFDERLLRGERLALGRSRLLAQLVLHRLQPPLLVGELRADVVVLNAEERVIAECMDVEPHRVARGGRRELPVDRRLTTALRVHLDVQRKELVGEPVT